MFILSMFQTIFKLRGFSTVYTQRAETIVTCLRRARSADTFTELQRGGAQPWSAAASESG